MKKTGYDLYFGAERLPVTPQEITFKVGGNNTTLALLNEGELSFLKHAKLTEISFDFLLPARAGYAFASTYKPPSYYLELLEKLKNATEYEERKTRFILIRSWPFGGELFDTNLQVSVEDYSVKESAKGGGFDMTVSVVLRQYVDPPKNELDIEFPEPTRAVVKQTKTRPTSGTTTVKPNDPAVNNVAETGKVVTGLNKFPSSDTIFTVREKDSRAYGAGSAGGEIGGTKMSGQSVSPWSGSGGSVAKDVQFITNLVNGAFSGLGVRFS